MIQDMDNMKNPLIDVDWLRSMQSALGAEALSSIMNDVAEQFAEQKAIILQATREGHFVDAARGAHLLKGAFLQSGFPGPAEISVLLEEKLQNEDVSGAEQALTNLESTYGEARLQMESALMLGPNDAQ